MNEHWFDTEKATQCAAIIAKLEGGAIDRLRLLKLLYLADREAMAERASPIVGGTFTAMNHGPVQSEVYDLIKSEKVSYWTRHFANDGHRVILVSDPGETELSPFEADKLREISDRFKDVSTWDVVEITHVLQEWKSCWKPGTSNPIPVRSVFEALGFSEDEIDDVLAEEESHRRFMETVNQNRSCVN